MHRCVESFLNAGNKSEKNKAWEVVEKNKDQIPQSDLRAIIEANTGSDGELNRWGRKANHLLYLLENATPAERIINQASVAA